MSFNSTSTSFGCRIVISSIHHFLGLPCLRFFLHVANHEIFLQRPIFLEYFNFSFLMSLRIILYFSKPIYLRTFLLLTLVSPWFIQDLAMANYLKWCYFVLVKFYLYLRFTPVCSFIGNVRVLNVSWVQRCFQTGFIFCSLLQGHVLSFFIWEPKLCKFDTFAG